jgi:Peptidase A4 family
MRRFGVNHHDYDNDNDLYDPTDHVEHDNHRPDELEHHDDHDGCDRFWERRLPGGRKVPRCRFGFHRIMRTRPPCGAAGKAAAGRPVGAARSGSARLAFSVALASVLTLSAISGGSVLGAAPVGAASSLSVSSGLGPEIPAGSPGGSGSQEGNSSVQTSVNWAGYVDTGTTFSKVSGNWVQPTASCPESQVQQAAFWVGIGGYVKSDPDIEQVGTDSDCLKGKGKKAGGPSYYAWYQMYPQSFVELSKATYPVAPGQTIESSVTFSGSDKYTLAISDVGHWTFSTVQSQASQPADQSAEWITEAPSSCNKSGKCKTLPLADFGSIDYSSASTNGESISGSGLTDTQIKMTNKNGKVVKAEPSSLGGGGSSFSVTWKSN